MHTVNITGVGKINSGICDGMGSGQESCREEEGLLGAGFQKCLKHKN